MEIKLLTYNNKTQNISKWAEEFGVSKQYIHQYLHIYKDVPEEKVLAHIDKNNTFKLPRKQRESNVIRKQTNKERIYEFICNYISEHKYAPSPKEISINVHLSERTIYEHLQYLIDEGKLETDLDSVSIRAYRLPTTNK